MRQSVFEQVCGAIVQMTCLVHLSRVIVSSMTEERDRSLDSLQSLAEITQLAGGLAHELRNPLSTIMINLKLLKEQLSDTNTSAEDMRRRALVKVDTLRREAERLQALFDDFLQLTGPRGLEPGRTDMCQLLGRLLEFLKPVLESGAVHWSMDVPNEPVFAVVDERLISQALLNLMINAQQAMADGGELRVRLSAQADWCVIELSDTGMGISPAERERIFQPFFSTKAEGTGLGLSITRRIVSDHGGLLSCESGLGAGTTFVVRLPLRGFATAEEHQAQVLSDG